jgi:hypothetical protein
MRRWLPILMTTVVLASTTGAQQPKSGTITGTVRDSSGVPVAGADVVAQPGTHRTRSDSTGAFILTDLDGGTYVVAARKLGYAPERWDVKLSRNGSIEVRFVLGRRYVLDTVRVVARHDCPPHSIEGFMCRQRARVGGVFMDYADIDDRGVQYTADLFRNVPGFRVELRRTRFGPMPTPVKVGGGCITSLVDGYPVTGANVIPDHPGDLSAVEIYPRPDSVPEPYRRYTFPERGDITRTGRCAVAVYWTIWAPVKR